MEQLTLRGLNIQWPFSQLLVAGVKVKEVRSYGLNHRSPNILPGEEVWLIETLGTVQAPANALTDGARIGERPTKAHIIGTITFSHAEPYGSVRAFRADAASHCIKEGRDKDWDGRGERYAWHVSSVRLLQTPVPVAHKTQTGLPRATTFAVAFRTGNTSPADMCPELCSAPAVESVEELDASASASSSSGVDSVALPTTISPKRMNELRRRETMWQCSIEDMTKRRVKLQGECLRTDIGDVQPLDTKGDGACGLHAVFGRPGNASTLECPSPRALLHDLLGHPLRDVRQAVHALPEVLQALRDIEIGLWSEFAVRTFQGQTRDLPEAHAFAALFRTPAFSELYERGEGAFKEHRKAKSAQAKFLKDARKLFTQEFRPMWEHLAAQTDWQDRVRPHAFTELFDAREGNDSKRNAFLCALCMSSDYTKLQELIFQDDLEDKRAELGSEAREILMRFATDDVSNYQEVEAFPQAPAEFAETAWPCFTQCICDHNYYLSPDELLLVCALAHRGVAIYQERDGAAVPLAKVEFPLVPTTYVLLKAGGRSGKRGHYERLVVMSSVGAASERLADAGSANTFPSADGDMDIESVSEDMNEESWPSREDKENKPLLQGACIDEASAGDEQTSGVVDRLPSDDSQRAAVAASQVNTARHSPSDFMIESEETLPPEVEQYAQALPGRDDVGALPDSEVVVRASDESGAPACVAVSDAVPDTIPSGAVAQCTSLAPTTSAPSPPAKLSCRPREPMHGASLAERLSLAKARRLAEASERQVVGAEQRKDPPASPRRVGSSAAPDSEVAESASDEGRVTRSAPIPGSVSDRCPGVSDAGPEKGEGSNSGSADASDADIASSEWSFEDELSDDEDVFNVSVDANHALPKSYQDSPQEQQRRLIARVKTLLRDNVTCPLEPTSETDAGVFTNVTAGILLPSWHCFFKDCRHCGLVCPQISHKRALPDADRVLSDNHVYHWWRHIWNTKDGHRHELEKLLKEEGVTNALSRKNLKELAFSIVLHAAAEKERENVPLLGVSTDRRCLNHIAEVYQEDNIKTLMCFICNAKHVFYHGIDKFGYEYNAGRIDMRTNVNDALQNILCGGPESEESFTHNLSYKAYKTHYGEACRSDAQFQREDVWEWKRSVLRGNGPEEILCNPEDVEATSSCEHDSTTVCSRCRIPICNACWNKATRHRKIPLALANDNFVGYVHAFFVEHNVTWLEATIASPLFSGLITYYIEGPPSERHHLMEAALTQPQHAYGVRGNIFSFLLPWDHIQEQLESNDEDLSHWPLAPDRVCQIVRVRMVRGPEELLKTFKELHVRAEIVRRVACIYIERHLEDLKGKPGALKIHAKMRKSTMSKSLQAHVDLRLEEHYPAKTYAMPAGALIPEVVQMVSEQVARNATATRETAFDMKQATMPDASSSAEHIFLGARPLTVLSEATTESVLDNNVVAEHALGQISNMDITMSNIFEDQFVTKYPSRIFPWALNYACGGPEYPHLFTDWSELDMDDGPLVTQAVEARWRRLPQAAYVTPGRYAQQQATRVEAQVASDWTLVPGARNLHWRYQVLHQSFLICKQKVAVGETLNVNLAELIKGAEALWTRLKKGSIKVKGKSVPLNGDVSMMYRADDVSNAERTILTCYLRTTQSIAGCQALRRRIGHCLFGFRVVHGECIFVTVSPNRRHSALLLRLSRVRRSDTALDAQTSVAEARRAHASSSSPPLFIDAEVGDEEAVEEATATLKFPTLPDRQAWAAQDPLSSVHHYHVGMRVLVPAAFGVRMCFNCPHCNADALDTNTLQEIPNNHPCQDCFGCNAKPMGGHGGLADGLAFATEFQGDGTPHGHGFVSLANAYQHCSLLDIAQMLEANGNADAQQEQLQRFFQFFEHLHREDHYDHEGHQQALRQLEKDFHANNDGPKENILLSFKPRDLYCFFKRPVPLEQPCTFCPRAGRASKTCRRRGCCIYRDVSEGRAIHFQSCAASLACVKQARRAGADEVLQAKGSFQEKRYLQRGLPEARHCRQAW